MPALVLGVDLGTQSCKAVACDARTLLVLGAGSAANYGTNVPHSGWAEQDPLAWEAALAPAIAAALRAARASPSDVLALAIAAQLDGCIATDADHAPLHPALIWHDRRAAAHVEPTDAGAAVSPVTGQIDDPSHLAPKAAWLLAHGVAAARFHEPTGYLVARLTGAARIDPALASTTLLLELATSRWSATQLAAYGLTEAQLPAIAAATDVAGTLDARGAALTGLPIGVPVAVGTGDDFATPLGAGIAEPGSAISVVGTAEVVAALSPTPVLDTSAAGPMVETHAYPAGGYFVENPGWLAGGAVRWAARMLGARDDAAFDRLAAAAPAGSGGVTFVPALAGAMTPTWRPHARGALYGLAASHGPEHVARAVLEGLAFATRDVVDRLAALGLAVPEVLVVGGGAASAVWNQIRADALGRPQRIGPSDTCAIGAAMIASVAAGVHADLGVATALAPRSETIVTPGASLDAAYARYRQLVATLAPLATSPWPC